MGGGHPAASLIAPGAEVGEFRFFQYAKRAQVSPSGRCVVGSDMDDLRRLALEEEDEIDHYENYLAQNVRSDKIFGMTPAERMFVSIGCFLVTGLGGFLLLLIMGKIAI